MNYIANTEKQQKEMLKTCGFSSIDELFKDIPDPLKLKSFNIPKGKSEFEVCSIIQKMAAQNNVQFVNFLGAGFYDHFIPSAIDAITSRSEFYTAYTPYQPELSQGTLQAIYEYQTDIARLTEMEVSNASLYDGGTALYEACQMARSATRRNKIVIDGSVNPIYRKMLRSYLKNLAIDLVEIEMVPGKCDRENLFKVLTLETGAVILQNPNFFGFIDDHSDIVEKCHSMKILVIQSVYPIALSLLKTPGEMGVDIATGEGQSLGIPLSFGGPYLGFMATNKKLARKIPGRIAGRTVDSKGRNGFVLTIQAREQHIRREKATSNICTNQALCALRAHIYLSIIGKNGLKDTAQLCLNKAQYTQEQLKKISGIEVIESSPTFNEFTIKLPSRADEFVCKMLNKGFLAGFPLGRYYKGLENYLLVAVTEKRTKDEIDQFIETVEGTLCQ